MTGHDLLSPEDERKLAQDIEAGEIATWRCVLSFGPCRGRLLARIEERLEDKPPEIASLRRAMTIARRRPSARTRAGLRRAIDKLATSLRGRDRDRELVDELVGELEARPPRGRGANAYLRRIHNSRSRSELLRNRFVAANLRLVVSVARRFARYGLPLDDLIQEGNLGLLKAVSRFDHQRGFRFSTYATWWIRHMIGRALANTGRTVRVPVHVLDASQRLGRTERALASKLGRNPTNEEIATELDTTASRVARTKEHARSWTLSLDQPIGEGGATRMDLTRDPANQEQEIVGGIMARQQADEIARQLGRLSKTQADVVRKRFGLEGVRARTLQDIADEYHLSRERIRQIESAALALLRKRMGDVA